MRVFIGIQFTQEERDEIEKIQTRYRKILGEQKSLRWIATHNLHITVVPPWYEQDIDSLKKKIKQGNIDLKPFSAVLTRLTFAPPNLRRLIWLEGSTPPGIVMLQDMLLKILSKPIENRRFSLHATLARFEPRHFSSFRIKHIDEKIHFPMKVSSFTLFESRLLRGGAEYKNLETIAF